MTANLDGNKDELCSASTPFVSVSWFLLLLLLLLLRGMRVNASDVSSIDTQYEQSEAYE